jgi:diguanylate cyclase (GGDEF)-like protein
MEEMSDSNPGLQGDSPDFRLLLRFQNPQLEREFWAHDCRSTISLARFCYFNAVLIWGGFGLLDATMDSNKTAVLWQIRFAIGEPILLIALAVTYIRPLWPWLKIFGLAVTFVLGTCVLGMLVVLGPPLSLTYYAGIILVLFPAFVFAQVRFSHAVGVSMGLLTAYWWLILSNGMTHSGVATATLAFMTTTVYIGLVACFLLERARRRDFAQLRTIARKNDHLRRLSDLDDLTRLFNRRRLEATLDAAIDEYSRRSRQAAILLIDIDNFKMVNDRLGHGTGDRILVEAAASIVDCLRPIDTAFRIGGDEFVVLLPDATSAMAATVALKVKSVFCERYRTILGDNSLPIGMSIGVAQVGTNTRRPSDLLRAGDEALYEAKRRGKGIVYQSDAPTEEGSTQYEQESEHKGKTEDEPE